MAFHRFENILTRDLESFQRDDTRHGLSRYLELDAR